VAGKGALEMQRQRELIQGTFSRAQALRVQAAGSVCGLPRPPPGTEELCRFKLRGL